MELSQIIDEAGLEQALTAPAFLLFKHSLICPTSAAAFNEYRHYLSGSDAGSEAGSGAGSGNGVPTAWLDVRGHRPLSLAVESRTGVRHESPQALYLVGGEVVWHASHGAITRDSLSAAIASASR